MSSICTVKYMLRSSLCFSYQNLFQNLKSKTEIINYSRYSQKLDIYVNHDPIPKLCRFLCAVFRFQNKKHQKQYHLFPLGFFGGVSKNRRSFFYLKTCYSVPINMKMDMQNSKRLWLEGRWLSRLDVIMSNALLCFPLFRSLVHPSSFLCFFHILTKSHLAD